MVKKTQIEMIRDRGYNIGDEAWILEDIIDKKKFKKMVLTHLYNKNTDYIFVLYIKADDDLISIMKTFQKKMLKSTSGIIIANSSQLKKLTKKIYEEYLDPLKPTQFFTYEELTYNVTKHIFSPIYIPIDKSLIIPSLAHANQLPVILADDPVTKYYGWLPGQVVKVIDDNFYTDLLSDQFVSYCIISSKILK